MSGPSEPEHRNPHPLPGGDPAGAASAPARAPRPAAPATPGRIGARTRAGLGLALLAAVAGSALLASGALRQTPTLRVPDGWPEPVYRFEGNPVTRAGFELGRRLFYDPRLSRDGSVACASCHQPFAAFAHFDHPVSHGIGGQNGVRNAPALFNLAWQDAFMWDGGITHLELQPLAPLTNPVEMAAELPAVLALLRADAGYRQQFGAAFGDDRIDSQRFLRALTQFLGTLVSSDALYDRVQRGRARYDDAQQRGYASFRVRCSGCHAEPLFTDRGFHRNGLAHDDPGRAAITGDAADRGRLRTPSLRNLGYSAPYAHDGRYETLREVLDHYAALTPAALGDDPQLAPVLGLREDEVDDLLAFLATLDDEGFIHDARFAEPR